MAAYRAIFLNTYFKDAFFLISFFGTTCFLISTDYFQFASRDSYWCCICIIEDLFWVNYLCRWLRINGTRHVRIKSLSIQTKNRKSEGKNDWKFIVSKPPLSWIEEHLTLERYDLCRLAVNRVLLMIMFHRKLFHFDCTRT